jgi:hypothetical protein
MATGFSLRGGGKKKAARHKKTLPVHEGPFSLPPPPESDHPADQFEYLRGLVNVLAHQDDRRCQEIRAGILEVVQKIAGAIDALQRPNPSHKQVEQIAKRAERAIAALQPDILEATYHMAHRYLGRHRHAHPEGSEHALSPDLEQAIRAYAQACRELADALRGSDREKGSAARAALDEASQSVHRELIATPAYPLSDD